MGPAGGCGVSCPHVACTECCMCPLEGRQVVPRSGSRLRFLTQKQGSPQNPSLRFLTVGVLNARHRLYTVYILYSIPLRHQRCRLLPPRQHLASVRATRRTDRRAVATRGGQQVILKSRAGVRHLDTLDCLAAVRCCNCQLHACCLGWCQRHLRASHEGFG